MSRRVIFFDIDGTLSTETDFTVPESTKKAIKLAQDNGHILMVNTGRTICIIEDVIKELGLDGYICGCGTNIYYHGKEIYHATLPSKLKKGIVNKALELDIDAVLEGPESIYFPETIKTKTVQEIKERYKDIKVNVPVYHKDDEPNFDKFTAWYTPEDDIEAFKDAFKDDLEYIQRAEDFIEVVPKACSKATGIQTFIDLIGASIDDCISIGDSTNDLPMLTYTKESVAMGNSNPVLFDYVTYITTDIEDDGIYNALKHFNII